MGLTYPGSDGAIVSNDTPPGTKPLQRPVPIIKADRLEYLLWDVADIPEQEQYLQDFGMLTVQTDDASLYMRGHGCAHYLYAGRKAAKTAFVGAGFAVNTMAELETLAAETGIPLKALARPGGGSVVALSGPTGLVIEVCFGIEPHEPLPTRSEALPVNTPNRKIRINQGQRAPLEPSAILKIGHCVTGVNRIEEAAHWYMKHLGLIASDVQCIGNGDPAICFMRLDRGDKPADHHSFVVGKGAGEGYLHSAYEVVDLDALAQGQQYLKSKNREHLWGIGRHLLGSQLFDYWKDPNGFEFEHYADGDVFTADQPTQYHPLDPGNVYAWGQDMPKSMLAPGPREILSIVKALFKGDITLAWIRSALKSVSRPARPWQ
jgi:hypothetical protein